MKTKLPFCKNRKWQNHVASLLIIFFMTVSTFSQSDGINFNCSLVTISFGEPAGQVNGFPYWIDGSGGGSTFVLFYQTSLNQWEVHESGDTSFPDQDPVLTHGVIYFASSDLNGISPDCEGTWTIEYPFPQQLPCTSITVDCNGGPIVACPTYYADTDGDGFGDPGNSIDTCDGAPAGFVEDNTDCDDTNSAINPGVSEVCDGIDNNCDGNVDEGSTFTTYYADTDGDDFGDPNSSVSTCDGPPADFIEDNTDCNDNDATIYPGATEIPDDGIDQDCDGVDDVTPLLDFVIVAKEEVHLHGNNVVTGNVGATDYDGKIKLHEYSTVSGSIEASEFEINNGSSAGSTNLAPAVVDLPPFVFNLVSADSDFDVKVEQGQTITLNDQIYGNIEVKEGGTLIFNNSNVFIEELKAYNNTTVAFTGCTNLFINKKVKFEDNTMFNSNGESVTMYVDDDVIVEEGSDVTAFIYANKYIEAKSKDENPVSMTGFFSGKKVKGEKAVSWQGQSGYIPCEIIEPEITEDDLCECKDGMVSLSIAYNGGGILSTNSGTITDNLDGTFTITNDGDKLENDLEISDGDGEFSSFATIHTSCSQEILNVTYDEAFTVISYTDNVGNTCEVNFSSKVAIEDVPKDEPALEFKVNVWPNPSYSTFNVKLQTPNVEDEAILQAFDINGRLIHQNVIEGNEDYQFGSNLNAGLYFVRITQPENSQVLKVIKR